MSACVTGVGLAVAGLDDTADLVTGTVSDTRPATGGKGMRHKDRASQLALLAVAPALADAGLERPPADRTAVVVSSNLGNLDTVCGFTDTIHTETVAGISPVRVPHMSSNVTACWVAIEHGLRGPNLTLCSGTPSGLDALHWARVLLAAGRADAAVVIGVEPGTDPVAELHRDTGGHTWLDGAVALVVESDAHARARGADVRAVVGGYARAATARDAVAAAWPGGPVGLCAAAPGAAGLPEAARTLDITAHLGRCSGALGLLQAAAALSWFETSPHGTVLAVAGGADDGEGDDTGAAALLLTGPRARHTTEEAV
ncbi:beta-ketoacyl synthase N-terminal-like domain-containing protein [Actinokineospora sp. G85]|uniref:beta-ketoacyl synthase N-terminal-like domain-containing protein n=1 Tax=Actinokineospora sp. G85 TaxID=3406626 RepID=UPI003C75B266